MRPNTANSAVRWKGSQLAAVLTFVLRSGCYSICNIHRRFIPGIAAAHFQTSARSPVKQHKMLPKQSSIRYCSGRQIKLLTVIAVCAMRGFGIVLMM
jgi:hypothetical protein